MSNYKHTISYWIDSTKEWVEATWDLITGFLEWTFDLYLTKLAPKWQVYLYIKYLIRKLNVFFPEQRHVLKRFLDKNKISQKQYEKLLKQLELKTPQ